MAICCCCEELSARSTTDTPPENAFPRFQLVGRRLAIIEILLALVILGIEAAGLGGKFFFHDMMADSYAGIWSSLFFIMVGCAGLVASRSRNPVWYSSHKAFIVSLVLCVVAIMMAIALFCLGVTETMFNGFYYGESGSSRSIGAKLRIASVFSHLIELVLFGFSARIACANLCCARSEPARGTSSTPYSTHVSRLTRSLRGLAIAQLALSLLLLALEIPVLHQKYRFDLIMGASYAGIWGGLIFLAMSVVGLVINRPRDPVPGTLTYRNRLLGPYFVLTIVSGLVAVALFFCTLVSVIIFLMLSGGRHRDYDYVGRENATSVYKRTIPFARDSPSTLSWTVRTFGFLLYPALAVLFWISTSFSGKLAYGRWGHRTGQTSQQKDKTQPHKRSYGLAVSQVVLAVPLILLEITGLAMGVYGAHAVNGVLIGLLTSGCFIASGVIGLLITRRKNTNTAYGLDSAWLTLSTVNSVLAFILFCMSIFLAIIIGPGSDYVLLRRENGIDLYAQRYYSDMPNRLFPIFSVFLYFGEFIVFCVSAGFGCGRICCGQSSADGAGVVVRQMGSDDPIAELYTSAKLTSALAFVEDDVFGGDESLSGDKLSTKRLLQLAGDSSSM